MLLFVILTSFLLCPGAQSLSEDYYQNSCPMLESILWNVTGQKVSEAPTAAAATVRLFFHDCFIEGCDGSILIDSTPNNPAEKDATINADLAGDAFDSVVRAKTAVEAQCPGVVSCADILAIAARNFVVSRGGPMYSVDKGRLDGLVSQASRVGNNIPQANSTLDQLLNNFNGKGLTTNDLVTLSGAHTFGFAHCVQFTDRLYNFGNQQNATDPQLRPDFASNLKQACPQTGDNPDLVEGFDPMTPFAFDNLYYQALQDNMALLSSDQALLASSQTSDLVNTYAGSSAQFFQEFATAMQKLGTVGVKTSPGEGEIRLDCTKFNQQ